MKESEIIELARQISVKTPTESEARRLENQLYLKARVTPQAPRGRESSEQRWIPWATAASVLFALTVGYGTWQSQRVESVSGPYGVVRGSEGASFEQHVRHSNGVREEIVLLEAGTLRVNVRKLVGRDRFLVVCGDAEVEVRGTRFEVNAEGGKLMRVRVTEGRVEVRPSGDTARLLWPGDEWHRPRFGRARRLIEVSTLEPPSPRQDRPQLGGASSIGTSEPSGAVPSAPESSPEIEAPKEVQTEDGEPPEPEVKESRPAPVAPKTPRQDVEAAFLRAWQLYKRGQFDEAAELFLAVIDSGDEHDIVEDALFLRCSALESAGHTAEAIDAAELYVRRFPNAVRREAVDLRRAWLELARENRSLARVLFTALLESPKESVRKEAQAGLTRVNQPAESKWPGEESD